MKIDFYCFPTKTGNLSVFRDLKQYIDREERFYYQCTQEDVFRALERGKLLLFDLRNNTFLSEHGKEVDITGKVIFPRSTIADAKLLLNAIEEKGGCSIMKLEDYDEVEYWFKKVQTNRKYKLTTLVELAKNLDQYCEEFGNEMFIKTVFKGVSGLCYILSVGDIVTYISDAVNMRGKISNGKILVDSINVSVSSSIKDPNAEILVYKPVNIVMDNFGRREWRAFVVNNELLSLSRCSDEQVPVEKYVYNMVRSLIAEVKGKMPASYVMDVFEYYEGDQIIFDILEFNPIISSGVYRNNDLVF